VCRRPASLVVSSRVAELKIVSKRPSRSSLRSPSRRRNCETTRRQRAALMLISVVQGASSFRGFTAIETPSIGPQRWPSRCSNRFHPAKRGEAVFAADAREVRLVPAAAFVCEIPGSRPAFPSWSWRLTVWLCGKIIGFGLKRAPGSRTRSRQVWEKPLRETPPLPFNNDRLRRRRMDSVRQALAIRQQLPGIPLLFERITQGALCLPCSAATQIVRANHSAAVVPTAKDGHGSESQGIQGRNRQ